MPAFSYDEAFSCNIGWVAQKEQRGKRVAIAGPGALVARICSHWLSIDAFDLANFNCQIGATVSTLSQGMLGVMIRQARDSILDSTSALLKAKTIWVPVCTA